MKLTRREALRQGGAAAAMLATAPAAVHAAKRVRPEALLKGGGFALGVSSGQPTTDGAILWTRVDGIERSGRVLLELSDDPSFRKVTRQQLVRAASVRDFCTRAKVGGLKPGEEHFFRFRTRDTASPVGRFRTLRPADSRQTTRIGFFSCQKYSVGHYAAHRALAEEDLDLVVMLGDYIYETGSDGPVRKDRSGSANGLAETLPDYQAKYRLYKGDPDLQAMHAAHPYVAIWDDHEVENNYAADEAGTYGGKRTIEFSARKKAGYEAFFQYHPVARDADDRSRTYRRVSLGTADLLLLDERQYRDPLICEATTPCPEGSTPGRSLLGKEQRAWLLRELSESKAPWKVLGNQVVAMGIDVPTGIQFNSDQWDGYADERRIIGEHVLSNGITGVTTITGDIHDFFAGTVTTDGRVSGRPWATEFVGSSISSEGIIEELGLPVASAETLATGLRGLNPHMAYADFVHRGYGVLELTPEEARCTFRGVRDATRRDTEVFDLAKFRVARGSTAVERA